MDTRPLANAFRLASERIIGQRLGRDYDTIVSEELALTITHVILGIALSVSHFLLFILDHPRSPASGVIPGLPGIGILLVVSTAAMWLPYIVSWSFSRVFVVGLVHGIHVFIVLAVVITGGAIASQWGLIPIRASLLTFSLSLVGLLLLASILTAALGGRKFVADNGH